MKLHQLLIKDYALLHIKYIYARPHFQTKIKLYKQTAKHDQPPQPIGWVAPCCENIPGEESVICQEASKDLSAWEAEFFSGSGILGLAGGQIRNDCEVLRLVEAVTSKDTVISKRMHTKNLSQVFHIKSFGWSSTDSRFKTQVRL